jgi:ribosomal protein L18E
MKILLIISLITNVLSVKLCNKIIGKSGKILLYPDCKDVNKLELSLNYIRETDINGKKVPKHFKENLASSLFVPGRVSKGVYGNPPVNVAKFNFSAYITSKLKKQTIESQLIVEVFVVNNKTRLGVMELDKNQLKFNIVLNNWLWKSKTNKMNIGISLKLFNFNSRVQQTRDSEIITLDMGLLSMSSPINKSALCGFNMCDVYMSVEDTFTNNLYVPISETQNSYGPSPSTGPSPSPFLGPSPSPYSTEKIININYLFPYFGNKLVYDPVFSVNNQYTNTSTTNLPTTNLPTTNLPTTNTPTNTPTNIPNIITSITSGINYNPPSIIINVIAFIMLLYIYYM